jgi:hypothetical protein
MTIQALALARLHQRGMTRSDADLVLEQFARTKEGSLDWDAVAPGLSRELAERIDRAAVGWINAGRRSELAPDDPFAELEPLPTERVRQLADARRNGPLVVALAQEVLRYRGVPEVLAKPVHDGKMAATGAADDPAGQWRVCDRRG